METYTQEVISSNGNVRAMHAASKATASFEILSHSEARVVGTIRDCAWKEDKLVRTVEPIMWHDTRFLTRFDPDDYARKPEISRYHSPDIAFTRWRRAIADCVSRCGGVWAPQWIYVKPFIYRVSREPVYYVNTYGFNNGTAIHVDRGYNSNIVPEHYFRADELSKARALARSLVKRRGDVGGYTLHGRIHISVPEAFKADPKRDHPGSDTFTRQMTSVVASGVDPAISGFILTGLAMTH